MSWKKCWAANKQGAADATLVEGCPCVKMGNIANRRILHEQFAEGGTEELRIPIPWTENGQIELNALKKYARRYLYLTF
jgi:hypothetical protein